MQSAFTNATLVDESCLQFFDAHRNVIPIPSIEGSGEETDRRRGAGISRKVLAALEEFQSRGLLCGVSLTVTAENFLEVTSDSFVADLRKAGCGIVMYLAYVPAVRGTEDLVLCDADAVFLEGRVRSLRAGYPDMILLSFPDDESVLGGCLAAGRGFFSHQFFRKCRTLSLFSVLAAESEIQFGSGCVTVAVFPGDSGYQYAGCRSFPYRRVYAVFS